MRRSALLPLALIVGLASLARADAQGVAVRATSFPLALSMRLDASGEHGCSQSYASSSEDATVHLSIDAAGVALLALDRTAHRTFGPSFGRWQEGERDVSHTTERLARRWYGRASAAGSGFEVRFDRVAGARVEYQGYGDVPLPPLAPGPATLRLACRVENADVYGAPPPSWPPERAADGETPTSIPLVRCAFPDGLPDDFGALARAGAELVLGAGTGVQLHHHDGLMAGPPILRAP